MRQRRAAALLLMAALILWVCGSAFAAESDNTFGDYLTAGNFTIDGCYTQDGMNAPYSEGYAPEAEDGVVHFVLPLLAARPVDGNVIYCDLHLGSPDTSPFAVKNYDSIPVRGQKLDSEAAEAEDLLYIAAFDLPLREDRTNGVYPLGVTIRYRMRGQAVSQLFSIDFAVTDGTDGQMPSGEEPGGEGPADWGGGGDVSGGGSDYDPGYYPPYEDSGISGTGSESAPGDAGGPGSDSAAAVSEPKVILEQVVAAPDPCDAGASFTVTCTLRNTSKKEAVRNMTVTYKSQSTDLMPESGASTDYIESIGAGATAQFAFRMRSIETAQAGPQKIDISLAYEGKDGTPYTAADEITVLIRQKIRLEHDSPTFPSAVYLGDTLSATLNLYNKGKGTLYNVTVVLDVPGITPDSSAFVGNMESGSSKSADIYATVTGIDGEGNALAEEDFDASSAAAAGGARTAAAADAPMAVHVEVDSALQAMPASEAGEIDDMEPAGGTGEAAGNFIITYEDEYGDSYEELVPVETQIESMDMMDPFDDGMGPSVTEPMEDEGMPWWGGTLIAAGGIGAVGGGIYAARRARRKRAAQLEAESADDDDLY